jgi:methionyl-tRNA formyltransferase
MRNRVVFFGTPEIGCAVLQTLLNNKALEVVGVVCQPDRPANHHKIYFSPVKQLAITQHLNLFQPEKLKQIEEQLKDLQPDLIVTCAYGLIVPESILKIPKYKCVNIHPSLLPKYRGPAPINYAIFNKDKITGVTLMYMDKGMDSGDIIAQSPPVLIAVDETYSTLYKKLTNVACVLLNEHIEGLFSTDVKSTKQDPNNITFSHMITKEIMQIN